MISVVKYSSEYKKDWNTIIKTSKNYLFMFERDYMEYHSDRFIDNSLMFFSDGSLIAVIPLNSKDDTLYSHGGLTFGGLIYSSKIHLQTILECFDGLKSYMRYNGFNKLIYKKIPYIYSNYPSEEDIYALFINNAKLIKAEPSATIDLTKSFKFSKGRKSQIARAKKNGIQIIQSSDFETFVNLENTVLMERHGAVAVHTADELNLLYSKFKNNIRLSFAILNDTPIAASLIFVYENLVHTQYLAANNISRQIGALDLLISSEVQYFSASKQFFDFGISTENNGLILTGNGGLLRQKEGFGARVVTHATYELLA